MGGRMRIKYDGYRMHLRLEPGNVRLLRHGRRGKAHANFMPKKRAVAPHSEARTSLSAAEVAALADMVIQPPFIAPVFVSPLRLTFLRMS
jgi:ATP-dependent DNA ligase